MNNFSFNEQPIEFILNGSYFAILDPIILKNVVVYLDSNKLSKPYEIAGLLQNSSEFCVGVDEIKGFEKGFYQLSASDIKACGYADLSKNICEIDSSFMMIVGIDKLRDVSRVFTWERFDTALRSPLGDDTMFLEIVKELGGPYFGVVASVKGTEFTGDGRYKLKNGSPIKV